MIPNVNPETRIPYGIIAANSIDPEILDLLLYTYGTDASYKQACEEIRQDQEAKLNAAWRIIEAYSIGAEKPEFEADEREFESIQIEEPRIFGTHQGVYYETSWLGGAMNLFIIASPFTKWYAACSPCVPGAGNLDVPDPDGILCYDVPPDWRNENESE